MAANGVRPPVPPRPSRLPFASGPEGVAVNPRPKNAPVPLPAVPAINPAPIAALNPPALADPPGGLALAGPMATEPRLGGLPHDKNLKEHDKSLKELTGVIVDELKKDPRERQLIDCLHAIHECVPRVTAAFRVLLCLANQ